MYVIFTKVALLLCNLSPLNAKRSKSNMQVNVCKEEITLFVCLCFALLGFSLCFFFELFSSKFAFMLFFVNLAAPDLQ